jgi:hypothetical protein
MAVEDEVLRDLQQTYEIWQRMHGVVSALHDRPRDERQRAAREFVRDLGHDPDVAKLLDRTDPREFERRLATEIERVLDAVERGNGPDDRNPERVHDGRNQDLSQELDERGSRVDLDRNGVLDATERRAETSELAVDRDGDGIDDAAERRDREARAQEPRAQEPRAQEPRAQEPRGQEPRAEDRAARDAGPEGRGDNRAADRGADRGDGPGDNRGTEARLAEQAGGSPGPAGGRGASAMSPDEVRRLQQVAHDGRPPATAAAQAPGNAPSVATSGTGASTPGARHRDVIDQHKGRGEVAQPERT